MPSFSRIVGHAQAIALLRRAAESGRVPGALLLCGPEGVGKRQAALALARALDCEQRDADHCPPCAACDRIDRGIHPDVIALEPEGQFIKAEQARAVARALALPPHEAPHRFVLIDPADRLNEVAANVLLKSLEEPRPDTHFALITAAPDRLLPTIRSRCQRVRFGPLSAAELERILAGRGAEPARAARAVAAADGSAARALELVEGDTVERRRALALALHRAAAGAAARPAFEAAAAARGEPREELDAAVTLLRRLYRDAARRASGAGPADSDRETQEAAALGARELVRRFDLCAEAQRALAGNANPTLVLEHLVLEMGRGAAAGGAPPPRA